MPPTINNISQLTKQGIADLYFLSLGNTDTRKNHVLLTGVAVVSPVPGHPEPMPPAHVPPTTPPVPKEIDLELDFTAWYGGVLSLAHIIDAGVQLPSVKTMCQFITPQLGRAQAEIAA